MHRSKTLLHKLWTFIKALPFLALDVLRFLSKQYVLLFTLCLGFAFALDWWHIVHTSITETRSLLQKGIGNLTSEESMALRFLPLGIAGFASVLFVLVRMYIAQRVAQTGEKNHLSQRFISAIEQLGAEKTVKKDKAELTTPNLEVRLGAIHTLEALMKESRRDYWPAVESLAAYLRENGAQGVADMPAWDDDAVEESAQALYQWAETLPIPNSPRQAAATALARRNWWARNMGDRAAWHITPRALPLARIDLRNMNLVRANLQGADLKGAQMQKADLSEAQMQKANLDGAQMQKAYLYRAQMQKAYLRGAQMQKAYLRGAQMQKANLYRAQMQKANLHDAQMQKAYLRGAQIHGANLCGADMTGAKGLTQDQINSAFGDAGTKLPNGLTRPGHWAKTGLGFFKTHEPWQTWLKSRDRPWLSQ